MQFFPGFFRFAAIQSQLTNVGLCFCQKVPHFSLAIMLWSLSSQGRREYKYRLLFLQPFSIYIYSESIDIYSLAFSVLQTNFKSTLRPISHYNYIAPCKYELDPPEPWNHRFLYTVCRFLLYQILGQQVLLHVCYCTAFKPIHCWKESLHENIKSFLDISVNSLSSLQLW